MAKIATLKKTGRVLVGKSAADLEGWELRETCGGWEDADRYRTAIINETRRCARVRYAPPNYLVEWRP